MIRASSLFLVVIVLACAGCASPEQRAFRAINDGNTQKLKDLLAEGLDANTRQLSINGFGEPEPLTFSLLHMAVILGDCGAVESLLAHGADANAMVAPFPNGCDDDWLCRGLSYRYIGEGRTLCEVPGWSPLMLAAAGGHIDVFRLLRAKGAMDDPARLGRTALHAAAGGCFGIHGDDGEKRKAMIEFLLREGYGINARTTYGETPLGAAIRWGKTNAAELLRSKGAQPS
jgi:ankyrin repeat protein